MISPVPAIFLLPGFLIIDGILTAFCDVGLRKKNEFEWDGEMNEMEHAKTLSMR